MANPALPNTESAVWRFARFEVWPAQRQVCQDGAPVALGARAFDVLAHLLAHQGRVVPKAELLEAVWPGLVVEENNLSVQVSALRKLLGPAVIATVAGRGYQFVAPPAGAAEPSPEAHAPAAGHALFGRDADLAALLSALAAHSLVTLVGPAGVGKTALAEHLLRQWPQPAMAVELAALPVAAGADAVVAAAVLALNVPGGKTPPRQRLLAHLADLPPDALLVLDNCEHLQAGAVAALLVEAAAAAPALRVLATSQVPLKLPREQVQRLAPLTLSLAVGDTDLARAAQEPAVALFMDQAQAVAPHVALHSDNLANVLGICQQLDGLPLALQLAAARVPLLGVHGVYSRLGACLRLLTQGPASAQASHQTLVAALDWSHALLPEAEQQVLRRLAVCAGGFDAATAQAVAGAAPLDEWAVLDGLSALVDKSLVVARGPGGGDTPRFMLLDTVRRYAQQRLGASGEATATAERHARRMAALVDELGGDAVDTKTSAGRVPLMVELDNLQAALDWATPHAPELALHLAVALLPFWQEQGHHREALRRGEHILQTTEAVCPDDPRRLRVCMRQVMLNVELGDAAAVAHWADASLALAQQLGDAVSEAVAHGMQGHAAQMRGDLPATRAHFGAALVIRRKLGDTLAVAQELNNIAACWNSSGEPERTPPLLDEALPLARQMGSLWLEQAILDTAAESACQRGQWDEARALAAQSLAVCRELGHLWHTRNRLLMLALIDAHLGRRAEARAGLAESLALNASHNLPPALEPTLAIAAALRAAEGDAVGAAHLLGALARERLEITSAVEPSVAALAAEAEAAARAALPDAAAWQTAWQSGQQMGRDEVLGVVVAAAATTVGQ